jgi:hypothetical protein
VYLRRRDSDEAVTFADWTSILGGWLIDGPISSSLSTEGYGYWPGLSPVSSVVWWLDYDSDFDWASAIASLEEGT